MKKFLIRLFEAKDGDMFPTWIVVLVPIMLLGLLAKLLYLEDKEEKALAAERAELTKRCDVLGDAIDDKGREGTEVRTIFFCPDGKFKIR